MSAAAVVEQLRPVEDTPDALHAALADIAERRAETEQRLADLRSSRAETLLSGTTKQIVAIEADARIAEVELERLEVMAAALQPRLEAARAASVIAAFESKVAEVSNLCDRANAWWRDEYTELAMKIRQGLLLAHQAEWEKWELENEANRINGRPDVQAAGGVALVLPPLPRTFVYPVGYVPPHRAVQLPVGPEGGEPIFWPQDLLGRPQAPQG